MGSAFAFCHSKNIIHRDLKPENLLLSSKGKDGKVKIGDFGLSKIVAENEMMRTACGTWAYCAPEVLRVRRDRVGSYDSKCDMFSVGVILFVILAGYHPFDPEGRNTDKQMQRLILAGTWNFDDPAWAEVSVKAKELITHLLEPDPASRYSAAQMLTHPWVKGTVLRGKLSSTIDKDLTEYRLKMRRKLKVGMKTVQSAMLLKVGGSKRRSQLETEATSSAAAAAAEALRSSSDEVRQLANPVLPEEDESGTVTVDSV